MIGSDQFTSKLYIQNNRIHWEDIAYDYTTVKQRNVKEFLNLLVLVFSELRFFWINYSTI